MGRFYETEKSRFVDDFIYKPNYNLMNAVLEKEQTGFNKVNADNADLLNQLKFKYIEESNADRANAEAIRAKYAKDVDVVTNQIRDTSKDWRTARPQIDNLKKDLAQNFATGDISKLQKSRDEYDKWKTELNTKVKDADTKTAAEKYWWDKWNKENPGGSVNKLFGADETYEKKDIQKEYNAEIKDFNVAKEVEKSFANPSGAYINSGSDTVQERTQKVIKANFENWVRGKGYEPYLQQREILPLTKQEKYYGDDKQLMSFSDKNSSMYDASESAAQLADFLKIKQDRGVVESQIYRDREKRANDLQDKAKEANDKANEGGLTISIPATEWFDETAEGKEQMRILDDKLFNLIPNSAGLTTEQKTEKLKQLSISGTEAQKREIRVIEIVYNKNKVSGYNEITELKGAAVAGGVRKRFADEDVKTKIKQSNVVFNFSKEDGMYGYNKKYMKNIEMGMTLAEMNKSLAGNRQLNKDSKKSSQFIPTTIEYIEESATPMFTLNNKKETGLGANAGYRMIQEEVRDPNTQEILRPRLEKTISGIISNHIVEIDVNNYSPIEGVKKSNQF